MNRLRRNLALVGFNQQFSRSRKKPMFNGNSKAGEMIEQFGIGRGVVAACHEHASAVRFGFGDCEF